MKEDKRMAETYESRMKRINAAVSLKEADRVPLIPVMQGFPVFRAGLSMKDVVYDFDKGAEAYKQYLRDFEPDAIFGHAYINMGAGPALELQQPKSLTWAGAPGTAISDDSIHQFLEFPVLQDDEMELFTKDYTGWVLERAMPRVSGLLEPFARAGFSALSPGMNITQLAGLFSTPQMRHVIETLWKISEMSAENNAKSAALEAEMEAMGFPVLQKGFAAVPFDSYSDGLRGTINSLTDLYEYEDIVRNYCAEHLESMLQLVRMEGKMMPGKWVFMALHKGMDGFMSDEQYREFYWHDLQLIIEEIIKSGMTPYIYTEGEYDSRLDCLKEVTAGKVVYHFETVVMVRAKKVLGDTACISGGFPVYLLEHGTRQQVIDECKRLIDGCAGGGGFIFETNYGVDHTLPGNFEAMMETVKEYGKY